MSQDELPPGLMRVHGSRAQWLRNLDLLADDGDQRAACLADLAARMDARKPW